ncbi:hypothetical protein J8J40_34920, partial [Mycobacterium tuberculosis]|nr:hypothetical protein [Mycobacterium tuberculosis]
IGRTCLVEWCRHATPLATGPGLAELLAGSAGFDAILHAVPGLAAHVVPAGALAAAQMDDAGVTLVMDALTSCYDQI